ncbi:adoMet-dependent rRNA methyltransferase spb1-like [Olea europaea var. sylvestris]|uniref:adoMet-dependent rRNA methyltransferase spb1-like n=1 Tax=Olea europaea var. sylvestris TaxID=158386 RepID=UPI000C1D3154|nr:adoMet-dependent rRNA methyltransferase spb1-like [Olea europaea var. sylvestris]
MGKVKGKHRLDKYYHLAKEHGYRSRAAWKLVQLDSKFGFLRSANSVLDLCAAPGGWMQVAVEKMPVGSLVIGVDLDPIRPIRGALSVQEDITQPKCRAVVKKLMAENGCRAFDLVLHDGSPNVGGAWAREATSQNALVIDSVKLATELLAPKGTFITKVFRSQDYTAVLFCLRQFFEKVEVDKPQASRSASAEIYIVGFKYKAPAKIDPQLLDIKHLFLGGKEPPKVVDVLRGTKQKRHRDGYEDGDTTLRKVCSAADFVWSGSPLEILGSVTSITFEDPACLLIKDHTLTTEEVISLCDDLRVLGKQDFKHLLKWRMQIRKVLSPTEKATSATTAVKREGKEDEDERILNEMEELTNAMEQKKKRAKKLLAKRQAKEKARKALGKQIDATEDGYTDHELFSLTSIKGKKELVAVDNHEYDGENDEIGSSDSEGGHEEAQGDASSDADTDEEHQRYGEQLQELLDEAYERFVAKKEGNTKQRKRTKQSYSEGDQLLEEGNDDNNMVHSDRDSDNDGDREVNPLVVPLLENTPSQEEIAAKWFSQDVFMDADEREELENDDSEDEMQMDMPVEHPTIQEKTIEDSPAKLKGSRKTSKLPTVKVSKVDDDFEIVPAPHTDSSDSSSDDSDEDDIGSKAEILACAKKMLTKKQREQILDDAYNKYMFHDEGLPKWFVDEEKKHYQPIKPVTKEEIAAMRAQFKEIDARPAKKVAQAKARKKRAAHRQLEKVRKKANSISDQTEISDRSKRKMIEQLYQKATPKKPKKEYVVAKKGVQVKAGKGKVLVDRRMKKDARKQGMNKRRKETKGKQKGKGSAKGPGKGKEKEKGKGKGGSKMK